MPVANMKNVCMKQFRVDARLQQLGGRDFPKLTTPQWIGEPGVEAAVILAVDDMNDPAKWERFLRPILNRLKQIDGRAPVSIMTVSIKPEDPQLQSWLKEGLSLETHTATHPCPCLTNGNFQAAADTYNRCVELMNCVPGSRPVAFRMPCCDSIDSASPRFFAEIFNHTNAAGQFLTIDSSVMNIFTPNDISLPRDLVADASGVEKFRKYIPFPSFVTTIEDYPYPYVIGKLCWEFPAVVPSDWEAQRHHGVNNPATVADWKAALDATVLKQGTMTMIFHPHGWIRNDQLVELIDYAVQKYGSKVKFLNFREAQDRLNQNLLTGHPLRAADGSDNGVRLLDLNHDGFLDVIFSDGHNSKTRIWNPHAKEWIETSFPAASIPSMRLGIIHPDRVSALVRSDSVTNAWTFDGHQWTEDKALLSGLEVDGRPVFMAIRKSNGQVIDRGVRLRDLDGDGRCELIVGNESQNAILSWSGEENSWKPLSYKLPPKTSIVDSEGRDHGLRFVDVNEDGYADVLFRNTSLFICSSAGLIWDLALVGRAKCSPGNEVTSAKSRLSVATAATTAHGSIRASFGSKTKTPPHLRILSIVAPLMHFSPACSRHRFPRNNRSRPFTFVPVSKSSWSPPNRSSRTQSPSSGAPTANSGSSKWAIIRWAWMAKASPAARCFSLRTRTAMAFTTNPPFFSKG